MAGSSCCCRSYFDLRGASKRTCSPTASYPCNSHVRRRRKEPPAIHDPGAIIRLCACEYDLYTMCCHYSCTWAGAWLEKGILQHGIYPYACNTYRWDSFQDNRILPPFMKPQCPLCGARFDDKDNQGCRACPSCMKCSLVLCPNCGHEFPKIIKPRIRVILFMRSNQKS